jgi:xyloglucan-specific exo-beta-1,4-glucanase
VRLKFLWPLFAALLVGVASSAHAQAYRWNNVAMGGAGFVTAVIPSKTQQNLVYARTDIGGAYRWDSANGRWVPLLDWITEADNGLMGVESLALDPRNSAIVYMVLGTSYFSSGKTVLVRSTDYGNTFSRVSDQTSKFRAHGNGAGRQNGERLQVDPGNSNVLYFGSRNAGLFRSTDAGATFSRVTSLNVTTTNNEAGISFVFLDPNSVANGAAQRIVVGVSRYGSIGPSLYRSDNGGASFYAVPNAPTAVMPQRFALAGDGNLYITYGNGAGPAADWRTLNPPETMDTGGIWRYNLAGGGWTEVTPSDTVRAYSGISVDPNNAQHLIASTTNTWWPQGSAWGDQFFVSINGGATWTNVVSRGFQLATGGMPWIADQSIHWAGTIEFDPFNTRSVWVTSGNGVFRTADIEATPTVWTFTAKGIEETAVLSLASATGVPLLSGIGDFDGFRHTDVTAYTTTYAPRMGNTSGLTTAAKNAGLVVRVGKQMFYSTDNGTWWTEIKNQRGTAGSVALAADGSALLHTVTVWNPDGSQVTTTYRTTNYWDSNPTWTTVSGLSNNFAVRPIADPVNANTFYLYDDGTLRISTDGGASFRVAGSLAGGGSPLAVAVPGRAGDLWIALKGGGLAHSTNAGTSFSTVSGVTWAGAVAFGKAAAGTSYPSVFVWGEINGGTRGVHRSINGGASWSRINDDAHTYGGVGDNGVMVGDMNTEGVVYMSTMGRGVAYSTPTTARLQARHSGKCADVLGASQGAGASVVQWTCGSGANQKWSYAEAGGGYYSLKAGHSGMCMDLASQSTANMVTIVQAACNSGASQQWRPEDMGGGYYRLRSRFSDKCLDVNGASNADGTALIQYTCGTGTNQQWRNQ